MTAPADPASNSSTGWPPGTNSTRSTLCAAAALPFKPHFLALPLLLLLLLSPPE